MPSTVYRGDLSEVTFGHETGIVLKHHFGGTGYGGGDFTFKAVGGTRDLTADTSVIEFAGGDANGPVTAGILKVPQGMLVGSRLIFSNFNATSTHFLTTDNYSDKGRMYTIVKHVVTSGDKTRLTITPALKTDHSSGDVTSRANDGITETLTILPFATPAFDIGMTSDGDSPKLSAESSLTDQFVGLVSTVALPETKVDLKRFHVVGLGRDVAVQVPGRYTNTGGSFECNIHNGRWFYYCLGQKISNVSTDTKDNGGGAFALKYDANVGDTVIYVDGHDGSVPSVNASVASGDAFVILHDALTNGDQLTDIQTYRGTATGGDSIDGTDAWPSVGVTKPFDRATKQEVRRILAVSSDGGSSSAKVHALWLDEPLQFDWAEDKTVYFADYVAGSANGSPHRTASTGALVNPVEHLYYSRERIPSFSMEVSTRRLDTDSTLDGIVDGGTTDSKQLLRVFRGCKVKDWSLTTDTDAALRLTVNFDSALVYTDTGRLESTAPGDRYNAHRLFENTGSNNAARKVAGIEKGTQKPFMFYNGIITVLGQTVGQVVSFTLNGKTGVEQYYTISGANVVDAETDQVPQAGTRNPTLAIEGKTEYDLEMEIVVDDPIFYHNMRRALRNHDEDNTDNADADLIRLSFTKQGSATPNESLDILIDDFFITEAPLPIPEDKGPIRSKLKIMPKSVKVVAKDTVLCP